VIATLKTAKFRVASLLALAISAIAVAGCGSASSSNSSTAAAAGPAPSSSTAATSSGSSNESKPESIGTAKGSAGTYLTADEGRTVYLWVADSGGKSACSGACAKEWPPVETGGKPKADHGVNAADLGTITRSDGSEQVTYNGHPLYYYAGDTGPGMDNGQGLNGFGAVWWLVAPSGASITSKVTVSGGSGGGTAPSSSPSSGGGYGY
jgi:predicted lipoprotein with Yx(FWY)xxD motif